MLIAQKQLLQLFVLGFILLRKPSLSKMSPGLLKDTLKANTGQTKGKVALSDYPLIVSNRFLRVCFELNDNNYAGCWPVR